MLSLIAAPNHPNLSSLSAVTLNFPAISYLGLVIHPTRRRFHRQQVAICFDFVAVKENSKQYESSWCCWCKNWESEGDFELEAEILEFMEKSEKPNSFPTKKELVDSGRFDLVEAIVKRGDWLSLGWDLDDEEEKVEGNYIRKAIDCDNGGLKICDIRDFEERVGSSENGDSLEGGEDGSSGFSCVSNNSSQFASASSSGRSLEIGAEEDNGIEGILNRIEKERKFSFGANFKKNGYNADGYNFVKDSADRERSTRLTSASPNKDIFSNSGGKLCDNETASDVSGLENSLEPLTWRSWGIQRAGFTLSEFEAAEISFNGKMRGEKEASKDEMFEVREGTTDALDRRKEINHNCIRTRLQYLELELASTLRLLRSKSEGTISNEDHESSSKYIWKLSDAWEFQENEVMNAQNRLRSIRAKLAILEGKMALSVIDAQKMAEEKQKRISGAHRALQLLRTACIVWHNEASQVLLVGSFDGWTTQRKMEKSSIGLFSLCLKLNPGRYEIKFIVDGIWRTDPLRPIVHNNGYENNLLIIT